MEKMNFDFLKEGINSGRFQTIAKNTKASDEIRPEFIALISINKMCLNGMASEMLGVETGCYLKAMILTEEQCQGDVNKKFFIMVSKTKSDDMLSLASVGKVPGIGRKLFLSYASAYPQFLQATANAQCITADKLEELGYAYGIEKVNEKGKPYTKYTANREVHYEIIDTGVEYPDANGSMLKVYACVNPKVVDRPYTGSEEDEEFDGVEDDKVIDDTQVEETAQTAADAEQDI